jgi:hypothetical protein
MKRWEYHLVKFDAALGWLRATGEIDLEKAEEAFAALGAEGWELVTVEDQKIAGGQTRSIVAFFKWSLD